MQFIKNTLFFIISLVAMQAISQKRYIQLNEIVTDSARIFTSNELEELKIKLTNFENTTTNQIVVLTIEELGYETIETYANGVFNENALGQKGKDNGILILFSNSDREVRIEVGYGLEPYITDAIASRIITNTMIPEFTEELYFKGINSAVDELIYYLSNPEALEEVKADEQKSKTIYNVIGIGLLSILMAIGSFFFYKTYPSFIELFRGILTGKIGFFRGFFILLFAAFPIYIGLLFITIPICFLLEFIGINLEDLDYHFLWDLAPFYGIAILIAIFKVLFKGEEGLKISLKSNKAYMRKTFSSSGTHSFGLWDSGGSTGGSSGGFSGGGGSSGGGGASGSW